MKKLGILTLVFDNYGTRLQSYALARVVRDLFDGRVSVQVINTESSWSVKDYVLKHLFRRSIKQYGLYSIVHVFNVLSFYLERQRMMSKNHSQDIKERKKLFNTLISQIPYSPFYSFDDIRKGCLSSYDALLVGSDQVWNEIKVKDQDIYMLDFWNKGKGLTYAASFGFTRLSETDSSRLKERLNHFSKLLIREDEGVRICSALGREDATRVLDPTLLLKKEDYSRIVNNEIIIEGDYVLVYSLNESRKIFREAYSFASRNLCKMVILKREICPPSVSEFDGAIELFALSPESFLSLILNAKVVITNSYHALLFSIVFNADFYLYLDRSDEENSRLLTISRMCGLEQRVYYEPSHLPDILDSVDFTECNRRVEEERARSLGLLRDEIEEYLMGS